MLLYNHWQSKIALVMALGITSTTAIPIMSSVPAVAGSQADVSGQLVAQASRSIVPAGTAIPVRYKKTERVIVTPRETAKLTLTVAENIRSERGNVVIPAGSQIEGRLKPAGGGTQFVAERVILGTRNQRYPIEATSKVITRRETITRRTNPNILKGAAIGAAAGAVLAEIFGSISLGEVLAGAGVGAIASVLRGGRDKEVEVVVVNPERDLTLTLEEDFVGSSNAR